MELLVNRQDLALVRIMVHRPVVALCAVEVEAEAAVAVHPMGAVGAVEVAAVVDSVVAVNNKKNYNLHVHIFFLFFLHVCVYMCVCVRVYV